ncbi:MAG: DUF2079 domain-containing protein [Saccharofermentanales bacterium]|jgi:uncharacterized membrane protein
MKQRVRAQKSGRGDDVLWSVVIAYVLMSLVSVFVVTQSGDLLFSKNINASVLTFQVLAWAALTVVMHGVAPRIDAVRRPLLTLTLSAIFLALLCWRSHDASTAGMALLASIPMIYATRATDHRSRRASDRPYQALVLCTVLSMGIAFIVFAATGPPIAGPAVGMERQGPIWSYTQLLHWGVVLALTFVAAALMVRASWSKRWRRFRERPSHDIVMILLASIPLTVAAVITVYRVKAMFVSTYDMGLFTQMFHSMKTTGAPLTTLERDGWLSHFAVHVSPIYYVMLPFYAIVPKPETLQVLQAIVAWSAAIPMYMITRHLLPKARNLGWIMAAMLLLHPGIVTGGYYDVHENCFLAPLLLWLLYFFFRRRTIGVIVFAVLTLLVKEDAALYVIAVGLYALLGDTAAATDRERHRDRVIGFGLIAGAAIYFVAVVAYLMRSGQGAMFYRFQNLMLYEGAGLFSIVIVALQSPGYLLGTMASPEKFRFALVSMASLGFLPLMQRQIGNFSLMIPFVLVNLLSDYPYQFRFNFQYHYGAVALLLCMAVLSLRERSCLHRTEVLERPLAWSCRYPASTGRARRSRRATGRMAVVVALACALSAGAVHSVAAGKTPSHAITYYKDHRVMLRSIRGALDGIPKDATVIASGFMTTALADRGEVYDIKYHRATPDGERPEWAVIDMRWGTEKSINDYEMFRALGYEESGLSVDGVAILRRVGAAEHP